MPADEKEGTEAAVGAWLKGIGDTVSEHQPLVEISTDKVTLEVAASAAGTLREQLKQPGDAVLPGDLLGTIETIETIETIKTIETDSTKAGAGEPLQGLPRTEGEALPDGVPAAAGDLSGTYSPAVRKLLRELGLDAKAIPKVGRGGRITATDVAAYLKTASSEQPAAALPPARDAGTSAGRRVPHTPMRKSIASHMAHSLQTAPHVTSVFEADLFEVLADRERRRQKGPSAVVPSVTAYIIRAAIDAIRQVPEVNSKWHDAHLETFDEVNFGVGTALDTGGLVVPVIQQAQTMSLLELSQKLKEMTAKARAGRLTHAEMQGGTFTLSNHGVSGSLLAAPIILPHGQAAILGAGKMQKRVIVCETGGRELFRVRPMMYVTLTVDHRVLDGQQTNGFLSVFVKALEGPFLDER